MQRIPPRGSVPALFSIATACLACGPRDAAETRHERTERNEFGLITCSEASAATTCYTHRTIIGVSMGASGAGQLAFLRPEIFDVIGMLGIPMVDWVFMMRSIERGYLGGFCDMETILANMSEIGDPAGRAFCGPARGMVKLEPSGKVLEPEQDFNHWYRWIDEGRGGGFGRKKILESFQDIALAFGNPVLYNPESPYFPPGVPMDYRGRSDEERCGTPIVIRGLHHKEYNPRGEYDALAFCDTATNEGDFLPERPSELPMEILLSVDYNRNGIRDFAEPVLVMAHERFQDVGRAPNDTYDWDTNPAGTADNWLHDEGEPYEDTGLDGVPGTGDFGEGNGRFDYNPNVMNYFAQNPRTLVADRASVPDGHLERMSIWADAGIRDFLQSAGGTNWFWGALRNRVGGELARDYTTFLSLTPGVRDYDFLAVDYSPAGIGRHAYVRYGDPNASEREIQRGDGHHVGPADQVLHRFLTSLSFVQSRFLDPDRAVVPDVGNVTDLIQPRSYYSSALSEERHYGVVLPPGYDHSENASKRYPVVYFLHGQGQESQDLLASAILFFGYMAQSSRPETQRRGESDWAKFILVFPDSTCSQNYCASGNFNANHRGIDGNGPRYFDSLFELMAVVESTYRVAVPVEVPRGEL